MNGYMAANKLGVFITGAGSGAACASAIASVDGLWVLCVERETQDAEIRQTCERPCLAGRRGAGFDCGCGRGGDVRGKVCGWGRLWRWGPFGGLEKGPASQGFGPATRAGGIGGQLPERRRRDQRHA